MTIKENEIGIFENKFLRIVFENITKIVFEDITKKILNFGPPHHLRLYKISH